MVSVFLLDVNLEMLYSYMFSTNRHFLLPVNPAGLGDAEKHVIPWRLGSDLNLVSSNKKLVAFSEFVFQCVTVHGVASFEVLDHAVTAKMHPPAT